MKRMMSAILIILFPYSIAFLIYCLFNGTLIERLFQNNIYLGIVYILAFWVMALISAVIICAGNLAKKRDSLQLARMNLIVKLVQIPAYLFIFIFGFICMFTIFTFAISLVLMLLDGMSIVLSGLIGVSAVKRNHADGILTVKGAVLHGIFQFVFCADVISAIIVYRKSKASRHEEVII